MNYYQIALIIFVILVNVIGSGILYEGSSFVGADILKDSYLMKTLIFIVWGIFMVVSFATYFYLGIIGN